MSVFAPSARAPRGRGKYGRVCVPGIAIEIWKREQGQGKAEAKDKGQDKRRVRKAGRECCHIIERRVVSSQCLMDTALGAQW